MSDGHLLDNNVISVLADQNDSRYTFVKKCLDACAPPIFLPVIAIAEIEFGMLKAVKADHSQQRAMREFMKSIPHPLGIDEHTVRPYSLLRAKLWELHATPRPSGRGHVEKDPIDLKDRVTGKQLGIDERDLLIVSVAVQYNLTLATLDRNPGMIRIEEAAEALFGEGKLGKHVVADWTPPKSS